MYTVTLFKTVKNWKQLKCSTGERMDKVVAHPYNEIKATVKRNMQRHG